MITHRAALADADWPTRRGIATLELVLALPLILGLVVGLVWLGYCVIGGTRVLSQVRHDVWKNRFEKPVGQPFIFSRNNRIDAEVSEEISVTPILRSEEGARAKLATEGGNWDHRSIQFTSSPNLKIATELMLAAKLNGVIAQFEDLKASIADLQRIGHQGLAQVLQDIATEITSPSNTLQSSESGIQRQAEIERDLDRASVKLLLSKLEAERKRLKDSIADSEPSDSGEDEDGPSNELHWLEERTLQRIDIEIELAELELNQFE